MSIISSRTSHIGATSYVIGCSVVGSLLLVALCVWVYYTNKNQPKHKKSRQNTKFFRISPVEPPKSTIIAADLVVSDYRYDLQMVVPVVDMNDHGDLHKAKKPHKSNIDSSIPSPIPSVSAAKLDTNSSQLQRSGSKISIDPSDGPELVRLPYTNTSNMGNDHFIPSGVISSNSSMHHSVSTDSVDTSDSSRSSVHSVSTDSSDTEDDSV